jgi:hypothetical protein
VRGYRLGEKLLRPAMVKVAQNKVLSFQFSSFQTNLFHLKTGN